MILKRIVFFITIILFSCGLYAQSNDRQVIQFTGQVVDNETLNPIPYVNITIKASHRGTLADAYGFFSFAAYAGEQVMMSCIGYKPVLINLPDTAISDRYSIVQALTYDTLDLPETVIYPWPTKEKFAEAFVMLHIPDDSYEIARKNLAFAEMRERANVAKMDGGMNYKNYIRQQTDKLYYAGQYQPNNLLNPMAWAEFIKIWKRQKETREKQHYEESYDPNE